MKEESFQQTKPKIGIDMDDVLMDFNGALLPWLNNKLGTNITLEDIKVFGKASLFGCEPDYFSGLLVEFYTTTEHENALPHMHALESLLDLSVDYDLIVVTSRADIFSNYTLTWINNNFPNVFCDIVCTNQFGDPNTNGISKSKVCEDLGIRIFIDDGLHNALEIAENSEMYVLLYDRPWNRVEVPQNIIRVHSWKDIPTLIRVLSSGQSL